MQIYAKQGDPKTLAAIFNGEFGRPRRAVLSQREKATLRAAENILDRLRDEAEERFAEWHEQHLDIALASGTLERLREDPWIPLDFD